MARTMVNTLGEMMPARADLYRERLAALTNELGLLHEEIEERLAPFAGRCIFLYHPAWGYFCDAYGLRQMAIEVEGKEPSDEELTRIQEQMRAESAGTLFVQPQISGRSVDAVARAVGAEVKTLDPLARDVIQNLRDAARIVAESFE
jgi:zinc transport system substrate-binding protein